MNERVPVHLIGSMRRVFVDECVKPDDHEDGSGYVPCACCDGYGEHSIGRGSNTDTYTCSACHGHGGWDIKR